MAGTNCEAPEPSPVPLSVSFALETAVGLNHEKHEKHEKPENKRRKRGDSTSELLTRPMTTPDSASPSPFVSFVSFVVPTAFSRFKQPHGARPGAFAGKGSR